jgi:hypothetical protein
MFDPNEPASPVTEFEPNGTCKEYRGLSKFEEAALRALQGLCTGPTIQYREGEYHWPSTDSPLSQMLAKAAIEIAEEFCRQMEERERNV